MIIGNGLIAKILNNCDKEDIVIFASGVSNSKNPTQADFTREENLILAHVKSQKKLFIYFSTISVHDTSVNLNAYIKHKLNMEALILKKATHYLIIRLPNILGNTGNQNTLFPFFKESLLQNNEVQIQKNAIRYILNSVQLNSMVKQILKSNNKNCIIHCTMQSHFYVSDIYTFLAKRMLKEPNFKLMDGGTVYKVPTDFNFNDIEWSLNDILKTALLE